MSARLPNSLLPPTKELATLFSNAIGESIELTDDDRTLLMRWEDHVRAKVMAQAGAPTAAPHRWHLPDERESLTARFELLAKGCPDDFVGYITMGMYEDGSLGELFLSMAKEGSFTSGIMDAFVTAVSIGLQHGVPLHVFSNKFKHSSFSPSGAVRGAPTALRGFYKSILDYLFHYLEHKFPDGKLANEQAHSTTPPAQERSSSVEDETQQSQPEM